MGGEGKRSSRPRRPYGYYELRRIVAANIRKERQRRNWSLENVAGRLAPYLGQMGPSTISAWENSRHDGAKGFTVEELYALARVFETRIAMLLAPPTFVDMPAIERFPAEEWVDELIAVLPDQQLNSEWRRVDADKSPSSKPGFGPTEEPF